MPTGDLVVNPTVKRFLSWNRISDNLIDYLRDLLEDGLSRMFPESGLFTYPVSCTFGVGTFTLTAPGAGDPIVGIDNAGRVLSLTDIAMPFSRLTNSYDDDGVSIYWVGAKYCQIPSGIVVNPRTGFPEYDLLADEIGETDNPDLVTDLGVGVGLRFDIPATMYPYVGRYATVWMVDPESSDPAVAIQTAAIAFGGGVYYVDVPDYMGQTNVSLTTTDYMIQVVGVTVIKSALNPFTPDYIVYGYIDSTGAPNTWTYSDSLDLSGGGGHTLQRAYDGLAGSGSGRQISVDDQAVELRQGAAANREDDIANASLRIAKDLTTDLFGVGFETEGAIDIRSRMKSNANVLIRSALADLSGNDYLRIEEAVSVAAPGNTVTFDRVGVDLTFPLAAHETLIAGVDMIEVYGSGLTNNGLYLIWSVAAGSVTVRELDATTVPALVVEAGLSARVYRPFTTIGVSPAYGMSVVGMNDFYRESTGLGTGSAVFSVLLPDATPDTDSSFYSYRNGDEVTIYANGDIETDGAVDADGDITSTAGAVVAQTNVTATTGDVTAQVDVKAVTGDITALAGSVNAQVDVTAITGDITASAGDIIATAGNVEAAAGNVEGGNLVFGTAIYSSTVPSFHVSVSILNAIQNTTVAHQWIYNPGDRRLFADGAGAVCDIPIKLGHGCQINHVDLIIEEAAAAAVTCKLYSLSHDFTAPYVPPAETLIDSDTTNGTGTIQKVTLAPAVPPLDIDTSIDYYVRIESATNGDLIYSIRVDTNLAYVYPF